MSGTAAFRALARSAPRAQARAFSTSRSLLDAAPTPVVVSPALGTVPPPKRPVGGFRGGYERRTYAIPVLLC
jgi:hypothetical protein